VASSSDPEIRRLRGEIDLVDRALVAIIKFRLRIVLAVARRKREIGAPIRDDEREDELARRASRERFEVQDAYREVVRQCREAALQGPDDGGDPGAPA
jgi:chorismate mutase